jgi:hypothetical protein
LGSLPSHNIFYERIYRKISLSFPRFACLSNPLRLATPQRCCMVIQACLVLHNLAVLKEDFFEEADHNDYSDDENQDTRPVRLGDDGIPIDYENDEGETDNRDQFARDFFG